MSFCEVEPGVRMSYEDRGSGSPIVFVHGWGGSGLAWDYQVLGLADRYRCITVDLRGHGASDKPWGAYDYDVFCRDLDALMRSLDLSDVTLVGWSMGGAIATKYVQSIGGPVTRLVTTGSAGPRFTQEPDCPYGTPPEQVAGLIEAVRVARTETIAGLYGNNFHKPGLEATRDWFIQIGWQVPAFVGVQSFEALVAEDLRPGLADMSVPVACFHGRHDQICAPQWSEYMVQRIPDARMVWFEDSGHVAFVEEHQRFNEQLAAFIADTLR